MLGDGDYIRLIQNRKKSLPVYCDKWTVFCAIGRYFSFVLRAYETFLYDK